MLDRLNSDGGPRGGLPETDLPYELWWVADDESACSLLCRLARPAEARAAAERHDRGLYLFGRAARLSVVDGQVVVTSCRPEFYRSVDGHYRVTDAAGREYERLPVASYHCLALGNGEGD